MRIPLIFIALFSAISLPSAWARPYAGISGIAASADSASTAAGNPAGMVRLKENTSRVELIVATSDSTWEGEIGDTGQTVTDRQSSTTVVPSGYMVRPINEDFTFGFTILGMGFSDDLGDWPGRYFVESYESIFVSAFPSIAYEINDQWSIAGSLQLSYTSYEQERAIANAFDPGMPDGSAELEADGWEVGFGLSTLYQFSDRTRIGLSYLSELDPSLDGDADYSNLGPNTEAVLTEAGVAGADIEISSRTPQSLVVGLYHEFENQHAYTVDVAWVDFSRFKLSEFYFDGETLGENEAEYEDILAVAASYSFPLSKRWMLGFSGLYVDDMISDDNRTMTLRLDSMWSLGMAAEWQWTDTRSIEASVSYIGVGDAPVSAPSVPGVGKVRGEFTSRDTWLFRLAVKFGGA